MQRAPLVVHLTYALDFGGLETLLVDCINRMPADAYRHAVVCLTDYTDFADKITQPGVELFALHKRAGPGARHPRRPVEAAAPAAARPSCTPTTWRRSNTR